MLVYRTSCVSGEFKNPKPVCYILKMGEKIHEGVGGFLFGVGFLPTTFE
jgi:hypothetical protein